MDLSLGRIGYVQHDPEVAIDEPDPFSWLSLKMRR